VRSRLIALAVAAVVVDAVGACAVDADALDAAPASARALRDGTPLAPADALAAVAVGRLVDVDGRLRCTATALGPRHVLTARHCLRPGGDVDAILDERTLGFRERGDDVVRPVVTVARHPDLDLALLGLGAAVRGAAVVDVASPAAGDAVTAVGAGLGTPDDDVVHAGRFVVDDVLDDRFTVVAAVDAGLCPGDSGAPVFAATADAIALVGVHVRGFDDCGGPSTAVRVDRAGDFLAAATSAPVGAAADACDGAAAVDHCVDDTLRRCVLQTWRSIPCAAADHACVDDDGQGARCAPVPCGDVSAAGRCEGGVALACVGGTRVVRDCAAAEGRGCALDPSTGRVGCVPCDACDGVCVDHAVDDDHCGACGHACARRERCTAGACVALTPRDDEEVDDPPPPPPPPGDEDDAGDGVRATDEGPGCAGSGAWVGVLCGLRRRRRRS